MTSAEARSITRDCDTTISRHPPSAQGRFYHDGHESKDGTHVIKLERIK